MQREFTEIISDYEKLIRTHIKIPIDNEKVIQFDFKPAHLPHLLGLNRLVDIPKFFEYANKRISAIEIFNEIKLGTISTDDIKKSMYFDEIFESKIKHFSSENILSIIKNASIIKFNPKKISNFDTKLEKLEYLFYQIIYCKNNKFCHFGIGFSDRDSNNFPNTFFVRDNKDYIKGQDYIYPLSIYIKDKYKKVFFKIYWNNVRNSLKGTHHYKKLKILGEKYKFNVDTLNKEDIEVLSKSIQIQNDIDNIKRHFKLLRLEEVNLVYKHYLDTKDWNNKKKEYLIDKIDKNKNDYLPNEINMLLNEFSQKIKKKAITSN